MSDDGRRFWLTLFFLIGGGISAFIAFAVMFTRTAEQSEPVFIGLNVIWIFLGVAVQPISRLSIRGRLVAPLLALAPFMGLVLLIISSNPFELYMLLPSFGVITCLAAHFLCRRLTSN